MRLLLAAFALSACSPPTLDYDARGATSSGAFGGGALGGGGSRALVCGDGFVSTSEGCDDGNRSGGDGCSSTCATESYYTCTGSPSTCVFSRCGDSSLSAFEQCDDGNATVGDGCDAGCHTETGYWCTFASPSVCTNILQGSPQFAFISDQMGAATGNATLVNGALVSTWKNVGSVSGDGAGTASFKAGYLARQGRNGHDVFFGPDTNHETDIGSSTTGLSFVHKTGIFDFFIVARLNSTSQAFSTMLGSSDASGGEDGFEMYVNKDVGVGANNLRMLFGSGVGHTAFASNGATVVPGELFVAEYKGDGTNITISKNCAAGTTTALPGVFDAGNATRNASIGNNSKNGTEGFPGEIYAIVGYNATAGHAGECAALVAAYPDAAPRLVVTLGDSITARGGTGVTKSYPTVLQTNLNAKLRGQYTIGNAGVGGNRVGAIDTRFTQAILNKGTTYALAYMGGTNDLFAGTAPNTATAIYGDTATVGTIAYTINRVLGAGIKTCLMTVIPSGLYTAGQRTELLALNALIRTHTGLSGDITIYDAWADFDDGAGGIKAGLDSGDHEHPNDAGNAVLAASVTGCLGL